MLITVELKDKILKSLISSNEIKFRVDLSEATIEFETSRDVIIAILRHFDELNLIGLKTRIGSYVDITLTANAFSFVEHGGFLGQEQILKSEFEKLQLELDALKNTCPERFNTITSIMANLATFLPFLSR